MGKYGRVRLILIAIFSVILCGTVVYLGGSLYQRVWFEQRRQEILALARPMDLNLHMDSDYYNEDSITQHIEYGIELSDRDIPIDFESLWKINPDIHAWIHIPGLDVDYPIVQHSENSLFYLNHTVEGIYHPRGAIFTEKDNARDFSDPHTIIYGHNMPDESLFGILHRYLGAMFMASYDTILIYTPDNVFTYRIFSAVTYDDRHLLDSFDFSTSAGREAYLISLMNVSNVNTYWNPNVLVTPEDTFITLSTCNQIRNQRLLVGAILVSTQYEWK